MRDFVTTTIEKYSTNLFQRIKNVGRINTEFWLDEAFNSEKKITQNSYCAKEKSRKL